MKIAVSACLLGEACRYDGAAKPHEKVIELEEYFDLIPVCPEVAGGLPTPRPANEIVHDLSSNSDLPAEELPSKPRAFGNGQSIRVIDSSGTENTEAFFLGAQKTVDYLREEGCSVAVLKAKSPSCGNEFVYDGTFSNTLIAGSGVAAHVLRNAGILVFNENQLKDLFDELSKHEFGSDFKESGVSKNASHDINTTPISHRFTESIVSESAQHGTDSAVISLDSAKSGLPKKACDSISAPTFSMYVLECADGTWYTGYAVDVAQRIKTHNAGEGAKYTRARLPVRLLACAVFDTKQEAMSAEYHFKQLTRSKKEHLVFQAQAQAQSQAQSQHHIQSQPHSQSHTQPHTQSHSRPHTKSQPHSQPQEKLFADILREALPLSREEQ